MLENTIHSIVGLARAEKALFTVTGISLGPFLHIDPTLYLVALVLVLSLSNYNKLVALV